MQVAKEIYMYALGIMILVMAGYLAYLLIFYPIPDANKAIVEVSFGLVLGWGGAVVGYFFGSSKSSADKTELLSKGGPQ